MILLVRLKYTKDYVLGKLIAEGFQAFTLERPWKNNEPNISCIPNGDYTAFVRYSPKFRKRLYQLEGVQGRSHILIHVGNTVDDSLGCILLGTHHGQLDGKTAVLNSRTAVNSFMDYCNYSPIQFVIRGL